MPVYTVHEPPLKGSEVRAPADRFRFVRDGFHFWAFLLAPVWMIWRRLWLVLVLYIVVCVALALILFALGISGAAAGAIQLLLALLVGLEASSLRRWTLKRRRWKQVGVVSARNLEDAERRFFDGWEPDEAPAPAAPPPPAPDVRHRPPPSSDIIGVFPEPGVPR
jgi:hypothetical protein